MRILVLSARGISLFELLVVLVITAVLATLAMSGGRASLDRVRVTTVSTEFRAALAFARAAAIRRGERVDLLPLTPAGWQTGWQVAIDLNNNQRVDAGEPILRSSLALPPGIQVIPSLSDSAHDYLAFDASGRPRSAHGASQPQFGSLLFRAGDERRKLVIGFLGRVRLCDPDRDRSAC